jgi:hypothetical protein
MYEGYRVEGTGTNRMIIGAAILAGAGLFSFVVDSMKKSASRKRVAQA